MEGYLTGRIRRKIRVRRKILKSDFPRLSVFRSQKKIYAQIIDDKLGKTLVAASEKDLQSWKTQRKAENTELSKIEKAKLAGKILAEKAKKLSITQVVFDRGLYKFHGRVKALAEGAREGGLKF